MRPLSRDMKDRLFDGYGPLANFAAKIDLAFALEILPYPQLVMARPRQRHRRADDLAGWSRHPAGADARGRVLRGVPRRAATNRCGPELVAVALSVLGDAGRLAAAGGRGFPRHRQRDRPRIQDPRYHRTGDADDRLLDAARAPPRDDAGQPPSVLHELSRGRGRRLFDRWRSAARLGIQGRVHGADLDLRRARQ